MRIELPYGRELLPVTVPDANLDAVLLPGDMRPLDDPGAETERCLRQPTGCPPLAEMLRGKRNACVVISDVTRYLPYAAFLPQLLAAIETAGVPRHKITILVAAGLHRATTQQELVEMLGAETAGAYRIVNHLARHAADSKLLGQTPQGMPVLVNKLYLEADFRVLVGMIEQHLMAGYSGGRKSVCPGICAAETIKFAHSPAILEHPDARYGTLAGNPVHEALTAAAQLAGAEMILNVVLKDRRHVAGVFAGALEAAFQAGVDFLERHIEVAYAGGADVVITSCTGYPLDATFYQAIKGIVAAVDLVKQDGTIIIASQLSEGVGSKEFRELVNSIEDINVFIERLGQAQEVVIDQWMLEELCKVLRIAKVMLYCKGGAVSPTQAAQLFVEPIETVEDGIRKCLDEYGGNARIVVLPQGEYLKKAGC